MYVISLCFIHWLPFTCLRSLKRINYSLARSANVFESTSTSIRCTNLQLIAVIAVQRFVSRFVGLFVRWVICKLVLCNMELTFKSNFHWSNASVFSLYYRYNYISYVTECIVSEQVFAFSEARFANWILVSCGRRLLRKKLCTNCKPDSKFQLEAKLCLPAAEYWVNKQCNKFLLV